MPGTLLIIWDRLAPNRSRMVREDVESPGGRSDIEFLSAYGPDLNLIEYIWAHLNRHELPNVCPNGLWNLEEVARPSVKWGRRRNCLGTALWRYFYMTMNPLYLTTLH